MLNWHSASGYLDQNIQQFGQIPGVLRRLSCQLVFQLSILLSIQGKSLQVQASQTSDHDSLHVYINWHIFCQLSADATQQQK